MKQQPKRRSTDRIIASSSPRVGGESTPCSTNVDNDGAGCVYIQARESYLAKERGVQVMLEIPPEPLVYLVQEIVENLVDAKRETETKLEDMTARASKLAYIASKLAEGRSVKYKDFGLENDDLRIDDEFLSIESEDEFIYLADLLLAEER